MTILWRIAAPPSGTPCCTVQCDMPGAITYQEGPIEAELCTPHAIGLELDARQRGYEIITVRPHPSEVTDA